MSGGFMHQWFVIMFSDGQCLEQVLSVFIIMFADGQSLVQVLSVFPILQKLIKKIPLFLFLMKGNKNIRSVLICV